MSKIKEEIWKSHPVYVNYQGSNHARVQNVKNKNYIKGHRKTNGYVILNMHGYGGNNNNKVISLHKFIYECFHGIVNGETHEIDHIIDDKTYPKYNYLENLQVLTTTEHNNKTHSGKNRTRENDPRKRAVIRIKLNDNNEEVERNIYDSTVAGAASIGITGRDKSNRISICCNNLCHTAHGYVWRWVENDDLPGEYWCSLYDNKFDKCMVSNLGRIEYKNIRSFGFLEDGYMKKKIKYKRYCVHYLVCIAFHGNPPSDKHTTDHINNESTDNNYENLRWATKSEQACNRKSVRKVKAVNKDGEIFKIWNTIAEAEKELKTSSSTIGRACRLNKETQGYTWSFVE